MAAGEIGTVFAIKYTDGADASRSAIGAADAADISYRPAEAAYGCHRSSSESLPVKSAWLLARGWIGWLSSDGFRFFGDRFPF